MKPLATARSSVFSKTGWLTGVAVFWVSAATGAARSAAIWLDWHALPTHLDTEARLSQLCARVLQAERAGISTGGQPATGYGLRLPGRSIDPDHGAAHRAACLQALALYQPQAPSPA